MRAIKEARRVAKGQLKFFYKMMEYYKKNTRNK